MARFKQEDFKQEPLAVSAESVLSRSDIEMFLNERKDSSSSSMSKDEIYKEFSGDLDKIASDLKAELESHSDADKGGDILEEACFNGILAERSKTLNKARFKFANRILMINAIAGNSDDALYGELANEEKAAIFLPFNVGSNWLEWTIGIIALSCSVMIFQHPFAWIGSLALFIVVMSHWLKAENRKKRTALVNETMQRYEIIKTECLKWAEELLDR